MSRQRVFSRTTKTRVREFCDISYPLAGPDRSHQATTERRIGRKPRKFRDKFESIPRPGTTFYNNDLSVAELRRALEALSQLSFWIAWTADPDLAPEPFVSARCIRDAANALRKAVDLLDQAADRADADRGRPRPRPVTLVR